jgi:hypothetical protein
MTEEILREYGAQTPPPSGLDVESVLSAGRARMRTRRWGVAGAAGLAVAVAVGGTSLVLRPDGTAATQYASPPVQLSSSPMPPTASPSTPRVAPQPAQCTIQSLRQPGGARAAAVQMDSTGRYVVGSTVNNRAVLWIDGTPHVLPAHPEGEVSVEGVNSSGVVVGNVEGKKYSSGFLYRDGRYETLGRPADSLGAIPYSINDQGVIAGQAEFGLNKHLKSLRWRVSSPSTYEVLSSSTATKFGALARAVAADGSIGGNIDDGDGPIIWRPDGSTYAPPSLTPDKQGKVFEFGGAYAIGWSGANNTSPNWVRWNLATNSVVAIGEISPIAVATDGTVVGSADNSTGSVPVLWRDDATLILPGRPGGTEGAYALDISDDGKTVLGRNGVESFFWRC